MRWTTRIDAAITAARRSALEGGATQRERDHIAALTAWHNDDWQGALELWEKILLENPLDVLALKLANHTYFYLGDARNIRDSIARVLYAWNEDTPGHGFVLGMYAFGLEECGDYANAEAVGHRAVEINPADVWAIHAVIHVLEMQGRHREGTDWLKTSEKIWINCNNFANHLWWHGALLLMDLERYHAVLDGYDSRIRVEETDDYLDIVNATSLLWRLEETGVDVGEPLGRTGRQGRGPRARPQAGLRRCPLHDGAGRRRPDRRGRRGDDRYNVGAWRPHRKA